MSTKNENLPKIGQKAFAFSLKNQDEKIISLKDYKDKHSVILYFYPKALTPGCTVQAQKMRDEVKKWKKLNAIVLGISPDLPAKLKKFSEKEQLNFDLLSDSDHEIALKYGVWGKKKFMGRVYDGVFRTTFIIDEAGKIQHILEDVKTKTHHEDLCSLMES